MFLLLLSSADFLEVPKINCFFLKKIKNYIKMLNRFTIPYQAGRFVEPHLGPNSLQRLSAGD